MEVALIFSNYQYCGSLLSAPGYKMGCPWKENLISWRKKERKFLCLLIRLLKVNWIELPKVQQIETLNPGEKHVDQWWVIKLLVYWNKEICCASLTLHLMSSNKFEWLDRKLINNYFHLAIEFWIIWINEIQLL